MDSAVKEANLGEGQRSYELDVPSKKGDHFASNIFFLKITSGNSKFPSVCKLQPRDTYTRKVMHSDQQFRTEVLMYKEILPLLGAESMFPAFYYGKAVGSPDEDAVLLEDLRPRGYRITDERVFLDLNHLRLGVRTLARFHAASLQAKSKEPKNFSALVSKLECSMFGDGSDDSIWYSIKRGMEPHFQEHGPMLEKALEAMKDFSFMGRLFEPSEPWAVVCHGDFCRNNMFFKYEDGVPINCMMYDLQNSKYSSPAIDLSFFLYLNMNSDLRQLHWNTLLEEYLYNLEISLPDHLQLDRKSFYEDFSARAIYGYCLCSFFLPIMTLEEQHSVETWSDLTPEQRRKQIVSIGGDGGTRRISDIVKHLIDQKYLHKFLDFMKK